MSRTRVAIACQGGGSHTAFTAGVLKRLVRDERFEIVALSGTSGGAVCALLTWYGLGRGDPRLAVELLDSFWADNSATEPWDVALNSWMVAASRMEGMVTLPAVSPYSFLPLAEERFRQMLEKRVPEPIEQGGDRPLLLIGAVDVLSGEFKAFSSARGEVTIDAVLASAAIPNLFRAVPVDGRVYWDGLFSQNPPVRELPDAQPDAIWVVQINPSEREREPTTVADIFDRRNELSGNLSLSQELYFIRKMNELVASGALSDTKYRHIEVATIPLERELGFSSKLDRSPAFLAELIAYGEQQADAFLAAR
ncbi:MAG: patatin-like phospholipase family protein [Actinomycetota bacterium]|nr:patatin-like phospholipase family protein [Actinomycetota bacterium]